MAAGQRRVGDRKQRTNTMRELHSMLENHKCWGKRAAGKEV